MPEAVPESGWPSWLIRLARTINLMLRGKINATASLTLAAGATTTTLTDSRIGFFSHVALTPATANAAAASGIYIVAGDGNAVVHHDSTADLDRTFSVLIIG